MPLVDPISTLAKLLKSHEIIPDVIPEAFHPSLLFTVQWPNGKKSESISDNELTKDDTTEEPAISLTPMVVPDSSGELVSGAATTEVTYTLVLTDPDAPSRADPKYRQFRHWVITGLKASPQTSSKDASELTAVKTKDSTTPYRPPGPGPGSVFLLFQESSSSPLQIPPGAVEYGAALEQRRSWNAVEFGNKYGLQLVGANFFLLKAAE